MKLTCVALAACIALAAAAAPAPGPGIDAQALVWPACHAPSVFVSVFCGAGCYSFSNAWQLWRSQSVHPLRLGLLRRTHLSCCEITVGLQYVSVQAQAYEFADFCGAQSGTGLLSQPTVLGQANQVLHPESGPYAPGQNLLPLGNLRTVDFGGPYNNGVYNLSLLSVQENEIKGASLSALQASGGLRSRALVM